MKKVLSLVLVCIMMLAFVPCVQATPPLMDYVLDGKWDFKYYADASEVPQDVTKLVFEDKIQVPGAMELQGYGYPSYYYEEMGGWGQPEDDGVRSAGVYKLDFEVSEWYAGEVNLVFESFMDSMTVYLDSKKLEENKNGAIGATFKVNLTEGKHTLICVVKRDKSGINKVDDFATSGITGSVYLTPYAVSYESKAHDVKVENNKLYIDGEEVVLKGIRYTPTHPDTGNTVAEWQLDIDLDLIKNYGFNCVWTSCAPDAFYKIAEEKGLYVIDEANVNLDSVDRDQLTAARRVNHMVEMHDEYSAIIMWSVGSGEGNSGQLIETVKKLDNRPVAQEVNFAPDFEVFGNTGGMETWVATLGEGNVGGFVDEFADKELYYTQSSYVFDVKDTVTGESVTVDGEVEKYKGEQYLGDASYTRSIENLDKYTIVTELSAVGGDRVIFESGNVKFEVRGGRARFNVGDKRVRADVQEGKIAAVYMDGEIQLFANGGFAENAQADAEVEGSYTVGGGETALGYIEIYNDALSLDELLEGADEKKLISRVAFDDINIKEDKSYKFLAYGGDFGDNPNSYYKCLTGIFSSTREPHPEAEAFKAILMGSISIVPEAFFEIGENLLVDPKVSEDCVVWELNGNKYEVAFDGRILNIEQDGKKQISEAMYPTVFRENTLAEYEMGVENYENWRLGKAEIIDNILYVELVSTVTNAKIMLAYSVCVNAYMYVSMQASFADDATAPTFIGFRGVSEYNAATWVGSEVSNYPDRRVGNLSSYTKSVSETGDNYAVPQENGNKWAHALALHDENTDPYGDVGEGLVFAATGGTPLEVQVLDYSPEAMEDADHDEDIVHEDKAYFRVGGYIAGVGNDRNYKLTANYYGFDMIISTGAHGGGQPYVNVSNVLINNERFKAFASGVKNYVYQTNENVKVTADSTAEVVQDDKKAVIGDYTIYFAPATEYMSDMTVKEKTAEIALDTDINGNAITMSGSDYWAPATAYDKGVGIKGGSVTYDVSGFNNHTFNAVVGKNSIDWRSMGGGFDRNMFNATCTVTIALDGVVVEEVKDISMRGGSREVNIDVSRASEMTITVTGSGAAPQYEDAVIANAAFVPNGPVVVNFEKANGKATITVLNTDREYADVVLTATENGIVTTEATSIGKGLYKTIEVKAGDGAVVKAYITGIGEINLE
ncbi:MAG: NPCBM/NEW2 domain-containing protein [Clostridia bacterium]|nr:NPCBM/NEW2 domain-containing protein [Clostridia bacterium]